MPQVNLMVVEDEGLVAMQIKEGLESLGYKVPVVALSGEEAISRLTETEIDLVLMDIRLKGGIDGIEAARRICSKLDIPIVYLTAYSDEETLRRATHTQPFGYVLKPFDERSLHATIQLALHTSSRQRKLQHSRQWLASIVRSMADALIVSDLKGTVRFLNPAAEALTGRRQEEVIGERLQKVFPIQDAQTREEMSIPFSVAVLEGGNILLEDLILTSADGTERAIDCSVAPLATETGNRFGIVLVFRDVTERRRRWDLIEHEIEATARMQKGMVPGGKTFAGIRCDCLYRPCPYGAGDILNYFMLDGAHLGFYLLDVMGHGWAASLFSMMLHRLLSPDVKQGGVLFAEGNGAPTRLRSPREVLADLNRRFYFEDNESSFFTIVYGIVEVHTGHTTIARAGHPYPLHQRRSGEVFRVAPNGFAIGLFRESEIEEQELDLESGDRLFIYSDGLTECANPSLERFGTERLIALLTERCDAPLPRLLDEVDTRILAWRGAKKLDDDVSLLVIERS